MWPNAARFPDLGRVVAHSVSLYGIDGVLGEAISAALSGNLHE